MPLVERASGRDAQPHELHNEARERGISTTQLRKFARHFGITVRTSDHGDFVDALGIDRALGKLIDGLE